MKKTVGKNWLAGRSDRREYWAYLAIVMVVTLALDQILGGPANVGATVALTMVQIRRVHDMGRTGWWVIALVVAQVVVMLPLALLLGDDAIIPALVIGLGAFVALGVIPGQAHENRFGPARGQRSLREIFS